MTKHETPFVTEGDLIIVTVLVTGPLGTTGGRFVLDTGDVGANDSFIERKRLGA